MEYAKKFQLIPENQFSRHTPSVEQMSALDKEMYKILTSVRPDDEKVKHYYELLLKKLNMQEFNPAVLQVEHVNSEQEPDNPEKEIAEISIVDSVPKAMTRHAMNLEKLLKSHPHVITWNKKGEITVNKQHIPQSNIRDLFHMVFYKTTRHFPGKEQFMNTLRQLNVPQSIIKNPHVQMTTTVKEELEMPQKKKLSVKQQTPEKNTSKKNRRTNSVHKLKWETWK